MRAYLAIPMLWRRISAVHHVGAYNLTIAPISKKVSTFSTCSNPVNRAWEKEGQGHWSACNLAIARMSTKACTFSTSNNLGNKVTDIDKPMDLECVADDFEEGAHDKLDEVIHQFSVRLIPENTNKLLPHILADIAMQSEGRLRAKYLNICECKAIISSEPRLRKMILDGSKNFFDQVNINPRSCGDSVNIQFLKNLLSSTSSTSHRYCKDFHRSVCTLTTRRSTFLLSTDSRHFHYFL
ncbi:hypothetical protein J3A83DRAFT_981087 [Scleroderma citrinum]